ncbi:hypothetical protein PAMP_023827 [Pampus punctatissimus]
MLGWSVSVWSPLLKGPDGLSLQPFSLIQSVWLSNALSSICLIWAFCFHLSSALRLKAAALPLFASLLGSEENDNNEAWRLSTASHTNIHTYSRNTDDTHNLTRPVLAASTHTCIFTHKHTGNVK